MRRSISLFLALALFLSLAACGGKEDEASHPSAAALTWQEQYDLGVRYLSEGKYAEAILAFTAAIEIDAKRSEAYIGLADSYIGLGDHEKALQAIEEGKRNCGEDDPFTRLENNVEFLSSGEMGIRITDFYFDKAAYLAGAETNFLVSVAYRCPENEDCVLMVGANTVKPNSFRLLGQDHAVTGSGGYQFHVALTPAQWDDTNFGIYVNLSEADHGKDWTPLGSDKLYIDAQGNVVSSKAPLRDNEEASRQIPQLYGTVSGVHIGPPLEGHNEGSVGQLRFDLAWDTASIPQEIGDTIATALIAAWRPDGFSDEEIAEQAAFYEGMWQDSGAIRNDYPDVVHTSFPVWENDLGTQQTVLMYAVDKSYKVVGYLVFDIQIPAA